MKYVDPPFGLGDTLDGTDSDSNLINTHWEGQVFEHPDIDPTASNIRGDKSRRQGRSITAVILRNTSGIALLPKRVVRLEQDDLEYMGRADGYAASLMQQGVAIVDEYLPAAGVANNDLFWGILCGPVTVLTPFAGTGFNGDIALLGALVAATYSATTSSSGGRVSNFTIADTATRAFSAAENVVGYALTARTTGETDTDMLIQAKIRY